MADNGVNEYWKFYRKQSEIIERQAIVFYEPGAKKKYISDLWKEAKVAKKLADEKCEKIAKEARANELKAALAENNLVKSKEEVAKLRTGWDNVKRIVNSEMKRFKK